MIASNMGSLPAEFPQERDVNADCGDHGPMSQQDAAGSHGHEMHLQKFVRLVGCHDSKAGKHEAAACSSLQRRRPVLRRRQQKQFYPAAARPN